MLTNFRTTDRVFGNTESVCLPFLHTVLVDSEKTKINHSSIQRVRLRWKIWRFWLYLYISGFNCSLSSFKQFLRRSHLNSRAINYVFSNGCIYWPPFEINIPLRGLFVRSNPKFPRFIYRYYPEPSEVTFFWVFFVFCWHTNTFWPL